MKLIICILSMLVALQSFATEHLLPLEKLAKKYYYTNIKKDYFEKSFKAIPDDGEVHPEIFKLFLVNKSTKDSIVTSLSIDPKRFPNVQEIVLSGDYIFIPDEISQFENLQTLRVELCSSDQCEGYTNFHFPPSFFNLKNLKVLYIESIDNLIYIPERISELQKLEVVVIYSPQPLVYLPVAFSRMPHLRYLYLPTAQEIRHPYEYPAYNDKNSLELLDRSNEISFLHSFLPDLNISRFSVNYPFYPFYHKIKHRFIAPLPGSTYEQVHQNGKSAISGSFDSEGKPHGKWSYWYDNGQLKAERSYTNGKETGVWSFYDKIGNKVIEYDFTNGPQHLLFRSFYSSQKLQLLKEIKDGRADGTWSWYDEGGKLSKTIDYKAGHIMGFK